MPAQAGKTQQIYLSDRNLTNPEHDPTLILSHCCIMLQPNNRVQYGNGPRYAAAARTFLLGFIHGTRQQNSVITSHSLMFLNPNTVVYKLFLVFIEHLATSMDLAAVYSI